MVGNVGRCMTSLLLDNTHSRTTSGVACHHRLWATHTIERRQAWHDIIDLAPQTPSNNVKRGMPSSSLGSTNDRAMSGVACHHRPWTTNKVERRWAWHAIIAFTLALTVGLCQVWHDISAFVQHTRSNDVGRGMTSSPLDCSHGRTTLGVA